MVFHVRCRLASSQYESSTVYPHCNCSTTDKRSLSFQTAKRSQTERVSKMSSQRVSLFNTFGVCLAIVVCFLNVSVQGGLQSPVCEFDCSNIGAVDAICGGHICRDGPLSNEASESLCSNLCQAAIADLNNDDCEATANRGAFYTAVDGLNSRLLGNAFFYSFSYSFGTSCSFVQ